MLVEMDNQEQLSSGWEGCYRFTKKNHTAGLVKKRRGRKKKIIDSIEPTQKIRRSFNFINLKEIEENQSDEQVKPEIFRARSFEKVWEEISDNYEEIQTQIHEQVLNSIKNYIKSLYLESSFLNSNSSLPIIILQHGYSSADVDKIYDYFLESIRKDKENRFYDMDLNKDTEIKERDLSSILGKICKTWSKFTKDRIEEENSNNFDFFWLSRKYLEHIKSKDETKEYFILLIRDVQRWDFKILQDLIAVLKHYQTIFPIVTILGTPPSSIPIYSQLPKDVSSQIQWTNFELMDTDTCFNKILDNYFLSFSRGLIFNSDIINSLLDQFFMSSRSITLFLKSLKFLHLDYFYSNPLSIFYMDKKISPDQILPYLKKHKMISHHHCEIIRSLPSFMNYINTQIKNSNQKQTIIKSLTDDSYLMDELFPVLLKRIYGYNITHSYFVRMIIALNQLGSKINISDYKKGDEIKLYNLCLHENIIESEWFNKTQEKLTLAIETRTLSYTDIVDFYQNILNIVDIILKIDSEINYGINLELDYLNSLFKNLQSKKAVDLNDIKYIVSWLKNILRVYLPPLHTLPLHEIIYYTDLSKLSKCFNVHLQNTMELFMQHPKVYFPTLAIRDHFVQPDISIAYILFQQAGKLINIKDWHDAFVHKLEKEGIQSRDSKINSARFFHTLNELKLLGYLQSTKIKKDHAIKLTW